VIVGRQRECLIVFVARQQHCIAHDAVASQCDHVGQIVRDLIAARENATESFWTLQTRRAPSEDWGDLTAFRSAEHWGDLSPSNSSVDYQN